MAANPTSAPAVAPAPQQPMTNDGDRCASTSGTNAIIVTAQLASRCLVTENISDFVLVESAWRAEHEEPHHGLILVAPSAFPRHQPRTVGRLVAALEKLVKTGRPEPGLVAWLESR